MLKGKLQEVNKREILKVCATQDAIEAEESERKRKKLEI